MTEDLKSKEELKAYLLGQITDEAKLDAIEERLFSGGVYLEELETAENELIDEYIFGELDDAQMKNFKKFYMSVPERREKVFFASALKEQSAKERSTEEKKGGFSIFGFQFSMPRLATGFAVCALFAAFIAALYIFTAKTNRTVLSEIASLHKNERPVEVRISGLEYAPFIARRGDGKNAENQLKREQIGSNAQDEVKQKADADSYNLLGVFLLTERRIDDSIAQFEKALKITPGNAEIRNNLGAAYLEKAKSATGDEKGRILRKSLDELNRAIELDKDRLEPLFNKALALQESNRTEEARAAWNEYIEKDNNSRWADDARENMKKLN